MDQPHERKLWNRLGWFVLLWVAGVLALTVLAWLIRLFMPAI